MSIKNLCVGFAIAASALVLTPTTSFANRGHDTRSFVQDKHNSRSDAYQKKFKDLHKKAKKNNGGYHRPVGVPELDPSGAGAAATLLLGGLLVAQGRRRRLALA